MISFGVRNDTPANTRVFPTIFDMAIDVEEGPRGPRDFIFFDLS